jgi:hypothetical protein
MPRVGSGEVRRPSNAPMRARLGSAVRRVEVGTWDSAQTELEEKRFSLREAQNWAARLSLMIFYPSAVLGASHAGHDREERPAPQHSHRNPRPPPGRSREPRVGRRCPREYRLHESGERERERLNENMPWVHGSSARTSPSYARRMASAGSPHVTCACPSSSSAGARERWALVCRSHILMHADSLPGGPGFEPFALPAPSRAAGAAHAQARAAAAARRSCCGQFPTAPTSGSSRVCARTAM